MDCEIEKICFELKFFSILRPDKNIGEISFTQKNPEIIKIFATSKLTTSIDHQLINSQGKIILKIPQETASEIYPEKQFYSKLNISPLFSTKGVVYFSDLDTTSMTELPTTLSKSQISLINTLSQIGEIFGTSTSIGITFVEVVAIGASLASLDQSGTLITYMLFIKTLV